MGHTDMMEDKERLKTFTELINSFDEGLALSEEYDSMLHDYNGVIMYQAESQVIKAIGDNPGITVSQLAALFKQSVSACSQVIKKLKNKLWVVQKRNRQNNREWNIFLTEEGSRIYLSHQRFENRCYQRSFDHLKEFSDEELRTYIRIQKKLNESFAQDVKESREFNYFYPGSVSDIEEKKSKA